ncbi:unnamed protein product [Natator depressus]
MRISSALAENAGALYVLQHEQMIGKLVEDFQMQPLGRRVALGFRNGSQETWVLSWVCHRPYLLGKSSVDTDRRDLKHTPDPYILFRSMSKVWLCCNETLTVHLKPVMLGGFC